MGGRPSSPMRNFPGMDVDGNGTVDLDEWLFGAPSEK